MSRVLILLLGVTCVLAATVVEAGETTTIDWAGDLPAALKAADVEHRPLLIFVTAPRCKYCDLMKARTLADPAVAAQVNRDFVPVLVDAEGNDDMVKLLEVRAYPTTVIVYPDAHDAVRIRGFVAADAFRQRLIEAQREAQRLSRR